jgi:hypothetical protein
VILKSRKDNFMIEMSDLIVNNLNRISSAFLDDPIKTIGAFASIGALVISWKNFKKDSTKVDLVIKRAQNGPLILQHPNDEYLIFEIYNRGISSVVINEIGIRSSQKPWVKNKYINLVDLPYSDIKEPEQGIGSLECVGLPGTIPGRSMGVFLLSYSGMKESCQNIKKQSLSSSNLNFGNQRLIKTFQEFQRCENQQKIYLQITPYCLTGSGERFIGCKSLIKLGNLKDSIS